MYEIKLRDSDITKQLNVLNLLNRSHTYVVISRKPFTRYWNLDLLFGISKLLPQPLPSPR